MNTPSMSSDGQFGGSGRSCSHHAQVMGTASFMISEGWKRMKPRSSQRCAPLPMWPVMSTTTSSITPSIHSGNARRRRKAGFTCASAHIATPPSATRIAPSMTRFQFWPEALYSTTRP